MPHSGMLRVDKSLSYLNDMLHHPSVFRLDTLKQLYVSKSTLNSHVRMDSSALVLPYHLHEYKRVQLNIHKNREFLIFLVFKLLERGVYISARNIAVLEPTVTAPFVDPGDGDNLLHPQPTCQPMVHCDILAFNAKKRHVYAIVVCENVCQFQQCRAHALRVVRSIRASKPQNSTVFAFVLTVYNFERAGSMRLCPVPAQSTKVQPTHISRGPTHGHPRVKTFCKRK